MKSLSEIKKDFPIFKNVPGLVYLDSAATSQKPQEVISAVENFYSNHNSNIHRGIYTLSQEATELFEDARTKTAKFVGGADPCEIIITGNASEAINLVANGYAKKNLRSGDVVVLSETEHHSNFVPWLKLRDEMGIKLHFLPIKHDFSLDFENVFKSGVNLKKIKLVALTHASNVLGTINPIKKITSVYKKHGITAKYIIDAAQSVPHIQVDVKDLGCDFLVFSAHKMLGPSGVGVLWAKSEILEAMDPMFVGSNMISTVSKNKVTWAKSPEKFEVGTGKLEGVVGLGAAIDYLNKVGMKNIFKHEEQLVKYALKTLIQFKNVKLYGSHNPDGRLGVFSFNVGKIHAHDVGEILNRTKVCVRTGHHCAQPLLFSLAVSSTVRASIYLYNNIKDIDRLAEGINQVNRIFKNG